MRNHADVDHDTFQDADKCMISKYILAKAILLWISFTISILGQARKHYFKSRQTDLSSNRTLL